MGRNDVETPRSELVWKELPIGDFDLRALDVSHPSGGAQSRRIDRYECLSYQSVKHNWRLVGPMQHKCRCESFAVEDRTVRNPSASAGAPTILQ